MPRQQSRFRMSLALLCLLAPVVQGCGSGTASLSTPAVSSSPANLNGNWLLTGNLPFTILAGNPLNSTFGAAMTVSVLGNNLVATLERNEVCGNTVASGPIGVVTGTVASDNSFAISTASTIVSDTATVTGTIPATADSSWAGHLDLTDNTTFCSISRTLNFTAVRIADVTGTYSGTASLNGTLGGTLQSSQAATFAFTLQQGNTAPGTSTPNAALLSGTATVQGTPCFTSGTLPLPTLSPTGGLIPISSVLGSEVELQATMNDGSTVVIVGHIMDTSSSKIYVTGVVGSGGTCGAFFATPFTLTKL